MPKKPPAFEKRDKARDKKAGVKENGPKDMQMDMAGMRKMMKPKRKGS